MVKYPLDDNRGDKISNSAAAQGATGMGFWKTVLGIARRPFIGLPVLGFALIFGATAYLLAPTHYVSSGYMVLTTPTSGGAIDPSKAAFTTNPLLAFNDGLKTTAAILIQSVSTPAVMAQLGAGPGGNTTITVNDGSTNSALANSSTTGPFIYVQVDSTSPVGVREAVVRAETYIRDDLTSRERALNAPKTTYLLLTDVVTPAAPVAKQTTRFEYAAGAGLGTVVLGLGTALAVLRIRGAGTRRAVAQPAPAAGPAVRSSSGRRRGPELGDQLVSSGPIPERPRTSLADHYWLGGAAADSTDQNWTDQNRSRTGRAGQNGQYSADSGERFTPAAEPVLEQDETREFPIVFDEEGDLLDGTGSNRSIIEAAAKPSDEDDGEPRRRPLTILRGLSDEEGDDAAHRAG